MTITRQHDCPLRPQSGSRDGLGQNVQMSCGAATFIAGRQNPHLVCQANHPRRKAPYIVAQSISEGPAADNAA